MIRWDMVSFWNYHFLLVYKCTIMYLFICFFFQTHTFWIMTHLSINYEYCSHIFFCFLLSKAFLPFPYHTHSASCPGYPASLHIPQHRALPHLSPPSSSTSASQSFSFILPLPHPHLQLSANAACAFILFFFVILTPAGQSLSELEEVTGFT